MCRIRFKSLLLPAFLALLASCSIKEDRRGCPCLLTVDLSQILDAGITPTAWWDKGLHIVLFEFSTGAESRSFYPYEEAMNEYIYRVAKGDVGVSGILGLDAGILSGREIRCPEGCQSDPLYVSGRTVSCEGEEARTVLEMDKQFTTVEITGLASFDYRMEVTAGSSGLDILTCKALEGRFRYPLVCDEDGVVRFRLPRQETDDVLVLMYDREDGHLDNAFPLGRYLTEIGYDWNAPSLADVSVHVDSVTISVSITVEGWTHSLEFPYVL